MKIKGKTNAMRILDNESIIYEIREYDTSDGHIDGVSVAHKVGKRVEEVFKTLVTVGHSKNYYVFVIPVDKELDMKKAAKAVNEKNIEMIHVKDINKVTGYIRGGCSPIGMKKNYKTVVDIIAQQQGLITISGGKIGLQLDIEVSNLQKVVNCEFVDITK
ncbi:MAG: Cys-tRNA(Pro) deacylase [Sarcina sp.]